MREDLTVMCGATAGTWYHRAERAVRCTHRQGCRMAVTYLYERGSGRFRHLLRCRTPYVLHMDADCLVTADPLGIPRGRIVGRRSPIHGHEAWDEAVYRRMLENRGLPYRTILWSGAWLAEVELLRGIMDRVYDWIDWYVRSRWQPFGRDHRKPEQIGMTLALAEAGILDDDTTWVGPAWISWHGHDKRPGAIHHYGGVEYAAMERAGTLPKGIRR